MERRRRNGWSIEERHSKLHEHITACHWYGSYTMHDVA
jgi:hypothetical protein